MRSFVGSVVALDCSLIVFVCCFVWLSEPADASAPCPQLICRPLTLTRTGTHRHMQKLPVFAILSCKLYLLRPKTNNNTEAAQRYGGVDGLAPPPVIVCYLSLCACVNGVLVVGLRMSALL